MFDYFKGVVGFDNRQNQEVVQRNQMLEYLPISEERLQLILSGISEYKKSGEEWVQKVDQSHDLQGKVMGTARVVAFITASRLGPIAPFVGALSAYAFPATTTDLCETINNCVQGIWKELSFRGKCKVFSLGVGATIVVSYGPNIPVVSEAIQFVSACYAAKEAADLCLRFSS